MSRKVVDYRLVNGTPGSVSNMVQFLLCKCEGWELKGEPFKMVMPHERKHEIVVQCMVRYKNNKEANDDE